MVSVSVAYSHTSTYHSRGGLEEHVLGALDAEALAGDPNDILVGPGCAWVTWKRLQGRRLWAA